MKVEVVSYSINSGWSQRLSDLAALDSQNTLIFVFGASSYFQNQGPLKDLFSTFQNSKIIGGSTSGEILDTAIHDETISVAICKFEKTRIQITAEPILNEESSFSAGIKIGKSLLDKDLSGIFVISEGLHINGGELCNGIQSSCPGTTITGGMAGDGSHFKKTWVICNQELRSQYVTAVGFYGEHFQMSHGSQGGWDIFGLERRITKSKGKIIYELDEKPALDLYKEYLGERAAELPTSGLLFPLQIRKTSTSEKSIVRAILAVDEKEKSLIFAGEVPENYLAQLMRANFDRIIDGAASAADLTGAKNLNRPALSVAISCVGRRLVLRDRTDEEVEAVKNNLSPTTKQIGFYSYGEISPQTKGTNCELHNQTMTLTVFCKSA